MWNILICCMRISQFFCLFVCFVLFCFVFLPLLVPNLFLALSLSFFSVFLLLLPFAFHILFGCAKTLGVN